MIRSILTFFAFIFSSLGISGANVQAHIHGEQKLVVSPGDIIVQQDKRGWSAIKILAIDPWPDGTSTAQCLTYRSVSTKPTTDSLKQAAVLVWHAPIAAGSFSEGWERIGNLAPTKDELVGFFEYLKLTDFPRYLTTTAQDPKALVHKANEHYRRAIALGDQGNRGEAVAEYTQAIDIFPLFYEAIDNRAFTYMELGKIREALADFEQSLRVNPNGMAAYFSRGECLMKLGDLRDAETIFRDGQSRFPEHRDMFAKFLEQVRTLQKKASP
ncbi:tetratricopeptide repeat protein [Oxalobacteraceae bacterium]|nr:tetratricopeptide repeat protein [Oxalobacteraceae bacterium]